MNINEYKYTLLGPTGILVILTMDALTIDALTMDTKTAIHERVSVTKSFVIPPIPSVIYSTNKFISQKMDNMCHLREKVNAAKSLYDEPYLNNPTQFYYIVRQFEHASSFRQQIAKKYNTPNVSNAWLKGYEIFSHYNLIPKKSNHFVYFDNAAFPGSFILAAWHRTHTLCDIKKFQWYASSLLSNTHQRTGPLGDKYKLYSTYPQNWLMHDNNNGDVTNWSNQENFRTTLESTVDLYTSDLGFDVSDDYTRQESMHSHANLGQIITGLMVLRKGGNMVTKQYTFFEPFTISLMGIMTRLFKTVEICKPLFSKSGNSETYLVCINYKGYEYFCAGDTSIQDMLSERLKNWTNSPMLSEECLGEGFMNALIKSQEYLARTQITKLKNIISEYTKYTTSGKLDRKYIGDTNLFRSTNERELQLWSNLHPVRYLPPRHHLRTVDTTRHTQRRNAMNQRTSQRRNVKNKHGKK